MSAAHLAPLVFGCDNWYLGHMFARFRRILTITLALSLAAGLVTHGVRAMELGSDIVIAAATGMPDMPMSGKCDGCAGDEKTTMPAACSAFCNSVIALPSEVVEFNAVLIGTMWPSIETIGIGHSYPPEPHPPKPIVLS